MPRPRSLLLCLLAVLGACGPDAPDASGPAAPDPAAPFEPLSPAAAVAKVKGLLTGLPPTAAEVAAVAADPTPGALAALIDGWTALPEHRGKLLGFFQQAFQQAQLVDIDLDDQLAGPSLRAFHTDKPPMLRSLQESFARTALQLVEQGRPFTEAVTTRRYMLNTPLLVLLAYLDATPTDDLGRQSRPGDGQPLSWLIRAEPRFTFTWEHAGGPIPIEESVDPRSANYMRWYDPVPIMGEGEPHCTDPQSYTVWPEEPNFPLMQLFYFLFGLQAGSCGSTRSQFTAADWASWRMVTVRPPRPGEERSRFYDLPRLRGATELVLDTPRVGFFTTPAFLANWPTNPSNGARVTINQALIVALGKSFDDAGTTVVLAQGDGEAAHARPGTACYGCHRSLNPMRQFLRGSLTLNYHQQLDPAAADEAVFALDEVVTPGRGVLDLAAALAAHPRFAPAWTQKLCRFANSAPCAEGDPELARVARAFADSGFSLRALIRELFSSPLVTYAARTRTSDEVGTPVSISRREHLCAALAARLGLDDPCGLDDGAAGGPERHLALSVPGSGYARGAEAPLVPRDPSLFFDAASERLCGLLAARLVDAAGPGGRFSSADPAAATADLVHGLLALPAGDPREAPVLTALRRHQAAALAAGAGAADALRSTLIVACSSPLVLATGL